MDKGDHDQDPEQVYEKDQDPEQDQDHEHEKTQQEGFTTALDIQEEDEDELLWLEVAQIKRNEEQEETDTVDVILEREGGGEGEGSVDVELDLDLDVAIDSLEQVEDSIRDGDDGDGDGDGGGEGDQPEDMNKDKDNKDKPQHFCHVCAPIPEEAVTQVVKKVVGISASEARMTAYHFLRYLKDNRHKETVQQTIKYVMGTCQNEFKEETDTSCPLRTSTPRGKEEEVRIKYYQRHSREYKLHELLEAIRKQNGAWGVYERSCVVISHLNRLGEVLTLLDQNSVKRVVSKHHVRALCDYLENERRPSLRGEVLDVLDLIVMKYPQSVGMMKEAGLPMEVIQTLNF